MIALFLIFISGMFEGVMDTLTFHYGKFRKKHKKAKDKFWNEEIAWINKYDNTLIYPKFFLSTTVLVGFTSGWHLMKLFRNVFTFASFGFAVFLPINTSIVTFVFILYGINRIGFNLIYKVYYK